MNKLIGLLLLIAGIIIAIYLFIQVRMGGKNISDLSIFSGEIDSSNQGNFNEDPHLNTEIPPDQRNIETPPEIYNIVFEAPEFPENNGDIVNDFKKMFDANVKKSLNEINRQSIYYDPTPPPPQPTLYEAIKGETGFTTRTGGGELEKWIGGR